MTLIMRSLIMRTLTMRGTVGLWMAFAVLAGALAAWSQGTTATILGTVKDQSDAVLPGATVTATNTEMGISRSAVTGSRGEFRISALGLGSYEISVNMAGFTAAKRTGITLSLGQEAVIDFTLAVGSVTEQVTVTGEAPLIETTTATVSGLVDPQQMRDMPLNARSFIDLVPLQAGAVFTETGGTASYTGFGTKVSVSGTRYNGNSFLLDGARINDASGTAGSATGGLAGVESVREFKIVTNAYDAEYGNVVGGVISAVTKSGTNQFHGSAFEFLRNDKLDAPSFDDNRFRAGEKAPYRRNQFGGTAGGPVKKDSLFFFGSFEALRESIGSVGNYAMPGPLIRQGCIPRTTGTGVNQIRTQVDCFNPDGTFTPTLCPAGVCPAIPATVGFINPKIAPYMAAYPQGNQSSTAIAQYADGANPDGTINLTRAQSQITNQNYFLARIDENLSSEDNLFFRYNRDSAKKDNPSFDTTAITDSANHFSTIEETHIFSPSLLAKSHFSFIRTTSGTKDKTLYELGRADYKLPIYSFSGRDIPGILSSGTTIAGWGGNQTNPKALVQNSFQLKEDFSYSKGRQALRMGGDFNRIQFNLRSDNRAAGNYAFGTLDNFLTNVVQSFNVTTPQSDNRRGFRQNVLGMYLQDDISLRSNLTLNVGLRYEIISVPTEVNGKIQSIQDTTPASLYNTRMSDLRVGDPYFLNPSLKNLAPRIGIAWTPFKNGRTSIRAGVGQYHDQLTSQYWVTSGAISPPFYVIATLNGNDFFLRSGQRISFPDAFYTQADLLLSGGGAPLYEGFEWKIAQPAIYKMSFSIQQQVLPSATLEVGYAGTRGTHLMRGDNQLNTSPVRTIEALGNQRFAFPEQPLPNPYFTQLRYRTSDGSSWYHGLLVTFSKRFSHGLQAQSSYSYSKSLDDGSKFAASADFSNDASPIAQEHWKGRSSFDVTHSWSTSFTYDIPGTSNLNGVLKHVLGGWNLSGIVRAASGNPLTPTATRPSINRLANGSLTGNGGITTCSNAQLQTGGCVTSPVSQVAGSSVSIGVPSIQITPGSRSKYFDVADFVSPQNFFNTPALANYPGAGRNGAQGALVGLGNLGRNTIAGPGVFNIDLTIRKDTPVPMIGEAGNLEFRFEMFNALNHTRLPDPGLNIFDNQGRVVGTAGIIGSGTSAGFRGNARQLQLAMRLMF